MQGGVGTMNCIMCKHRSVGSRVPVLWLKSHGVVAQELRFEGSRVAMQCLKCFSGMSEVLQCYA